MIGGELFGIMGIIFFIPLTAVVIELVKEDAAHRAKEKKESLERCSDNMYNKKIYKSIIDKNNKLDAYLIHEEHT